MVKISAQQIDALLPQTQCRRCGYDGCAPYAQAIAAGDAEINRCPPGGTATIEHLAALTGLQIKPLAPECGTVGQRQVAFIREDECIGCTKCIQVCPVDAIVGAAQQMHTVIAAQCTGCELCVPACPVDCIDMPAAGRYQGPPHWPPASESDRTRAALARRRFESRNARLLRARQEKLARRERRQARLRASAGDPGTGRKAEIAAAVARARAKRLNRS